MEGRMTAVLERMWGDIDYGDRLDRTIEWLAIGLLAFMPLAFGVVQAWSEEAVIALAGAISVCFCLKMVLVPNTSITWTWAYLPIAAFILIAVLQVVPMPVALVQLISPETASRKMELFSELDSSSAPPSSMTVSFYVHATKHDLRLLLAAAAVFFTVFNVVRQPGQIARLLGAIAVIGGAIAALALVQAGLGNGKLYWFVPSPHGVALSGPFVNHSHFAQFMNLSIGAALGLILMRLHRRFSRRSVAPATVVAYIGSPEGKALLSLMLVVVLGAASIFVSLSRGGIISTMIAGTFTVLGIGVRRPMKGSAWILALLALAAFACVLYVGFDAVYDRLGTLRDVDKAEGGRWQIVKDIAVAWTRFPVLGTGLGTHEVVYPMFDRATTSAIASHAENEYAQAAEETGLAGFLALVVFGAIVWTGYTRSVRALQDSVHAVAYGLGFGLMAIMVHSLSDFGQHLPANAFLSAVFCAILVRLSSTGLRARSAVIPTDRHTRTLGAVGLVAICALFTGALHDADRARRGEACWATALRAERDMAENDWQGSDEEYTYLLRHAAQAQKYEPANITYRHWLNVYRWRAISRVTDPNTGEVIPSAHVLEFADRIAKELTQGLMQCPTHGPTWTVLGQMKRYIVPGSEDGARLILRGRQLAPNDPITCLVAGMLYTEQGNADVAFEHIERAVRLDGGLFAEAASLCIKTLDRPDLAFKLASDNALWLIRAEQILKESGGHPDVLSNMSNRILALLEQECDETDARAWKSAWLAQRYRSEGRIDDAIEKYRDALTIAYSNVSWRFSLAQLLAEKGRTSEAVYELDILLRLQPQYGPGQRLREGLLLKHRDAS
jgi:tetratricopeptide (TPR) repeat protein